LFSDGVSTFIINKSFNWFIYQTNFNVILGHFFVCRWWSFLWTSCWRLRSWSAPPSPTGSSPKKWWPTSPNPTSGRSCISLSGKIFDYLFIQFYKNSQNMFCLVDFTKSYLSEILHLTMSLNILFNIILVKTFDWLVWKLILKYLISRFFMHMEHS